MVKQIESTNDNVNVEQLKNWKRGEPKKTEERRIWTHHGYGQVSVPKSFLRDAYESLFEREIVLVSRDPKTLIIFREIKLVAPKKLSEEFEEKEKL
jgi:hypothetical protein